MQSGKRPRQSALELVQELSGSTPKALRKGLENLNRLVANLVTSGHYSASVSLNPPFIRSCHASGLQIARKTRRTLCASNQSVAALVSRCHFWFSSPRCAKNPITSEWLTAASAHCPKNRWISPFGIRPPLARDSFASSARVCELSRATRSKLWCVPNAAREAHALLVVQHLGHPNTRPVAGLSCTQCGWHRLVPPNGCV